MTRIDGRAPDEIRPTKITTGFQTFAEGSALIEVGLTRVACAATVEERVPPFLRGQGKGWVTAEYAMLPRATTSRTSRERSATGGRTAEIQRLIGRCLRAVTQMDRLGERTFIVDCDVLQADGGTRTAAVTGAYVALYQALLGLVRQGVLHHVPLRSSIAATSVGVVDGEPVLDLCYAEDFRADVDFNVCMTETGEIVEVQGTAEHAPFSRARMDEMLTLAEKGIRELTALQQTAVATLMSSSASA